MRTRKSSIVGKMCFFIIISTLFTALAISIVSKKSMSSSIKEERDGKAAFIARVIQEELGDDVIEEPRVKTAAVMMILRNLRINIPKRKM